MGLGAGCPGPPSRVERRRMSLEERRAEMPAWPLLMGASTAALYLEIAERSFRALARRAGLRPVDLGLGVVRWRRDDVDALVAALPRRGAANDDPAAGAGLDPADAFDAAIARSALRSFARPRRPT